MKRLITVLSIILLAAPGIMLVGCTAEVGTLQFYAEGEELAREGLVSWDGYNVTFEHIYVTLSHITGYQTDPPYDPETQVDIEYEVKVSQAGTHTVDLAQEGGVDDPRQFVGEVSGQPAGWYNALSWRMVKATTGPASGYSLLMIATATNGTATIEFEIGITREYEFRGGTYVGDEVKGILNVDGTTDLEMTFHLDHIFGELEEAEGLRALHIDDAPGFGVLWDNREDQNMIDELLDLTVIHLAHVGEGHCRVIPLD